MHIRIIKRLKLIQPRVLLAVYRQADVIGTIFVGSIQACIRYIGTIFATISARQCVTRVTHHYIYNRSVAQFAIVDFSFQANSFYIYICFYSTNSHIYSHSQHINTRLSNTQIATLLIIIHTQLLYLYTYIHSYSTYIHTYIATQLIYIHTQLPYLYTYIQKVSKLQNALSVVRSFLANQFTLLDSNFLQQMSITHTHTTQKDTASFIYSSQCCHSNSVNALFVSCTDAKKTVVLFKHNMH